MAEPASVHLVQRVLSALILGTIVIVDTWVGGWSFSLLVGLIALLMAYEWGELTRHRWNSPAMGRAAMIVTAVACVSVLLLGKVISMPILAVAIAVMGAGMALFAQIREWPRSWLAFGVIYIALPVLSISWMRDIEPGGHIFVLWLFAIVWATDSAAFFVGRAAGGPKLLASVSPNKTWSGALGGVLGAVIAGVAVALWIELPFILGAAILAVTVSVVAQIGDLYESWLKRGAGVKDSSQIIPGHGGVLDRLDGLLFAAPVFAMFAAAHPR
ncbi:MAG: phosphatidate cytidylyltransferase [Geminicoccaceae bacterium]